MNIPSQPLWAISGYGPRQAFGWSFKVNFRKVHHQWQGSNLHPSDPKSKTLPLHHWRPWLLSSLPLFIYLSSFQLPCVCLCVFKRDCVRAYVLLCYSSSFFVFVFWYKLRNTFLAFWVYCSFICVYPGNPSGLSQGIAPVMTLVGALRWISEKLTQATGFEPAPIWTEVEHATTAKLAPPAF